MYNHLISAHFYGGVDRVMCLKFQITGSEQPGSTRFVASLLGLGD